MTVSSVTRKAGPFAGNNSAATFPFSFKVFAKGDVKVLRVSPSGVSTPLTLDSDYSVQLNSDQNSQPGGWVTYPINGNTSPLGVGYELVILGDLPYDQETDITNAGGFYPSVVEDMSDRSTIQIQQLQEIVSRAIVVNEAENTSPTLPTAQARANTVLGFDALGGLEMYPVTPAVGAGDLKNEVWKAGQDFTAGVSTSVATSRSYGTKANLGTIVMDGVPQDPDSYSLNGTTLTFLDANGAPTPIPASVAKIWGVGGTTLSVFVPPAGSVGDAQIAWGGILKRVVSSMAALAALQVSVYQEAFATDFGLGYGGGGAYSYNATVNQASANGATIVASTTGTGCWVLKSNTIVSLQTFGATGNGATDDTTAINNALSWGGTIDAPAGTYVCTSSLKWKVSSTRLRGAGRSATIFKFTVPGQAGLVSATKGVSQLLHCHASDIQFLDDAGLGFIVDMTDMMFSQFERCFTFGAGAAGSIGVNMKSSNTNLQCTYNRIQDHYNGNTQYGVYMSDGANANIIDGGRFQSGVAGAIGIILAPTGFNLVNGNSIRSVGVEQPGNTMVGIQLNGNTSDTEIISPRFEALLTGIVVSSTDVKVLLSKPAYFDCTNTLIDASDGKAFLNGGVSRGNGGPAAQFNYNGATQITNKAVNCAVTRTAIGQYSVSGLPFGDANYTPNVCSSAFQTSVLPVDSAHCNVFCYNAAGGAIDASIFGTFSE